MKVTNFDIEKNILRQKVGQRGGGIEIALDDLGKDFKGEKMTAYQNYLGGGMLGAIGSDNTIHRKHKIVEESIAKTLEQMENKLKRYFHELTNPEGEWESMSLDQNQNLPQSAY